MQRHVWQTVAAVLVMTLTFFVTALFVMAAFGADRMLHYFEQQPQLTIYLKDTATSSQVTALRTALKATGQESSDHYTSKDEALAFYKSQTKDNPLLSENLSANVLPASVEVSSKDIHQFDALAEVTKNKTYDQVIDTVVYQKDMIDRLVGFTSAIRMAGLVLIGFLALVSFLIILVTIGMNITSYKEEIEVMRLVGAESWYVRTPFILEGILYGAVAAVLSVAVVYFSLPLVARMAGHYLNSINIFPVPVIPVIGGLLLVEIGFGVVLGVVGSWAAMRRSLRV